ncbi:unnamed protein product [Schistosoma curassoni]|uniref:Transposase n=1 Tax=Schistosoma curassoni TaxID=6186 RepID=A0A183JEM6_9TREM|nr:unnamed protein product [Schistosoma curassoni]
MQGLVNTLQIVGKQKAYQLHDLTTTNLSLLQHHIVRYSLLTHCR